MRHILTGHRGVLRRVDHPDAWAAWARVEWDPAEPAPPGQVRPVWRPGMTHRGLAYIAPGLLVRA